MSPLEKVLAALTSVGVILGAVYGVFKWVTWQTRETPEGAKEKVDEKIDDERKRVEETGRP